MPTPTPILEARGSRKARQRAANGERRPPLKRPSCPAWLSKEAKAEWRRQIKQLEELGLAAEIDRAVLAAYCDAWGELVEVNRLLEEAGGAKADNWRLLAVKARAREQLAKLAQQFGFSPSSRARVKVPEQEQKGNDGKARFFGPN
jgi:P27 family predicted phage terminase small subunit